MTHDVESPAGPSVTTLVNGIITDAQELIRQQFAMFRREIQDDMRKTKEAARSLALGIAIALAGGLLLVMMLPLLLSWALPNLPLWACYGIVGGVLAAAGGLLAYAGVHKFKSFNPLPDQSVGALMENLKWKTNPK